MRYIFLAVLCFSIFALNSSFNAYSSAKLHERRICAAMYERSVKFAKSEPDCLPYIEEWESEK